MRNLWVFISKYNAFFLFIICFIISITLIIRNNSFQRSGVFNSSNEIVGEAYSRINKVQRYLRLAEVNDSLAKENATLRKDLKMSHFDDSLVQQSVVDTISRQQYTYIVARIVNNSIHQKNNYITINRGSRHGILPGMGVICSSGVVGIVKDVSADYATIYSLLHSDTKISASITENQAFGSLVWGEGNSDPRTAVLQDIPNHIQVKIGQHVVTSGYSTLFPEGLPIGRILRTKEKGGESFPEIVVRLDTDFSTLQYVYVIKDLFGAEKEILEKQSKKDG
ncbi:Rod shape-determining protein MreC [Arcticibacter svalbardensis MN12-7]|uniref:Cell shape-determining protein MreC n=1 Tax=Arcticibacter svalbardensis MN12-7 TaxID=1150600 RepID=R9GWC2_9SPHI|nr:rod shape-determining protein MreC [Arcticibacter svalbardensis]EOR93219.1 Rod shape-determining protein MreC [Arcticibacter svalbardensis MN12-7]